MNENVDPQRAAEAANIVQPRHGKMRSRFRYFWLAGLGIAALFGWQIFENLAPSETQKPAEAKSPPQTIRASAAETGNMPQILNALGTVTPLANVIVKAQTAGKLMQIGFAEGQIVKAGDFLAQVDDRSFLASLAQAQGLLAKDTALLAQAQSDLTRYQTLSRQDSIAHQQVDDQTYLVAQDRAAMAGDQAQIDAAKLNIDYAHIVAPIAGRVGLRQIDVGNYVQPADANGLVAVTQMDPISVVFSTPEDTLPQIAARLQSGATLPVEIYDRGNINRLAAGVLTTFDNQIDPTTGTIKLRAIFANSAAHLFPNQFVNVRLTVDTIQDAVTAPNAAIQLGPQGSFVYVVRDDSTVSVRKIVAGAADTRRTIITSGLSAGENVVIDGVDRLRDGAKVQLALTADNPAAAAPEGADAAKPRKRGKTGQGGDDAPSPSPRPAQ